MYKVIPARNAPIIVICSQEFATGYESGKVFVEEGQEVTEMDSERLIANLKSLAVDGVFNGRKMSY